MRDLGCDTSRHAGRERALVTDLIFRLVSRRRQIPLPLGTPDDLIEPVPEEPQTLERLELLLGSDVQQVFYLEAGQPADVLRRPCGAPVIAGLRPDPTARISSIQAPRSAAMTASASVSDGARFARATIFLTSANGIRASAASCVASRRRRPGVPR